MRPVTEDHRRKKKGSAHKPQLDRLFSGHYSIINPCARLPVRGRHALRYAALLGCFGSPRIRVSDLPQCLHLCPVSIESPMASIPQRRRRQRASALDRLSNLDQSGHFQPRQLRRQIPSRQVSDPLQKQKIRTLTRGQHSQNHQPCRFMHRAVDRLELTEADKATMPVNPPPGVNVMVEVLPWFAASHCSQICSGEILQSPKKPTRSKTPFAIVSK